MNKQTYDSQKYIHATHEQTRRQDLEKGFTEEIRISDPA